MNDLIDQMFGDRYITLQCQGGECLHYSQVPGYVVCFVHSQNRSEALIGRQRPEKPDNTLWVALSVASALFVVLLAFLGTFLTFSVVNSSQSPYSPLVCRQNRQGRRLRTNSTSRKRSG